MLREIPNPSQHPGEARRRWFTSPEQDLYVWYDAHASIVAFQLCYGKSLNEHAFYWRADRGWSHLRVDDGEGHSFASATPILVADGAFDAAAIRRRFATVAGELPADVVAFVTARLDASAAPASPPDS